MRQLCEQHKPEERCRNALLPCQKYLPRLNNMIPQYIFSGSEFITMDLNPFRGFKKSKLHMFRFRR